MFESISSGWRIAAFRCPLGKLYEGADRGSRAYGDYLNELNNDLLNAGLSGGERAWVLFAQIAGDVSGAGKLVTMIERRDASGRQYTLAAALFTGGEGVAQAASLVTAAKSIPRVPGVGALRRVDNLVDSGRTLRAPSKVVSVPRSTLRSADEIYGGVRQASKYLQEMGVSRAERVKWWQAFEEGTIVFRQAGPAEYGIRYFGGRANPEGAWLFETFPASRQSLALFPGNQMTGFRQFQIRAGTPIIQGRAAAQGWYLPGGQVQKKLFTIGRPH